MAATNKGRRWSRQEVEARAATGAQFINRKLQTHPRQHGTVGAAALLQEPGVVLIPWLQRANSYRPHLAASVAVAATATADVATAADVAVAGDDKDDSTGPTQSSQTAHVKTQEIARLLLNNGLLLQKSELKEKDDHQELSPTAVRTAGHGSDYWWRMGRTLRHHPNKAV